MKKRLKLTALAFSLLFCFPAYADETGFYVNNSYVESETVQNEMCIRDRIYSNRL